MSTKKIFIAAQPEKGESNFFWFWRLARHDGALARREAGDDARLVALAEEVTRFSAQMQRQMQHIDEIKRLCHVPTDD